MTAFPHSAAHQPPIQFRIARKLGNIPIMRASETMFVDRLRPSFPIIVRLWIVGAGVLSLRLFGGWVLARQWVLRSTRPIGAPWLSLSMAANGGNLLARVRRIINPQEESMNPVRIIVGLAVVLTIAPIWLIRADDQPANAAPEAARPPNLRRPIASRYSYADVDKLQHYHQEQERVIDRPIKEREELKQGPFSAISGVEAEKTFKIGLYYKRIGKLAAAEFYFEKIVARWPNSPWSARARAEQLGPDPKPDDCEAL